MDDKEKLIKLLKKLRYEKLKKEIKLVNISDDINLIKQGILFDNEKTCYYNYEKIDDIAIGLCIASNTYGIYYNNDLIGIISYFNHYYKDLSRLELSITLKNNYRNSNIGLYVTNEIIDEIFKNDKAKSIHLSIRNNNVKSKKLVLNLGFKEYKGYKCDDFVIINNKKILQKQYLLNKKDYLKNG